MTPTNKKVIDDHGTIFIYDEWDEFHCEDGPAVKYESGDEFWYIHGKLHREDGPAIIYSGNRAIDVSYGIPTFPGQEVEWWYNDEPVDFEEFCKLTNISDEDKILLKLKYA